MSSSWVIQLAAVTSTGNVTQLYPTYCDAGVAAGAVGERRRSPGRGILRNLQIKTDGQNGGTIEIWDIDGTLDGADVNTLTTITNAQLTTALAAKRARLLYEQRFTGAAGADIPIAQGIAFAKGLAARFSMSSPAANIKLNLVVDGGFYAHDHTG